MRIVTGISGSLLVLTFALTGCGSDDSDKKSNDATAQSSDSESEKDSDSSSSEPLDACGLLTPADLEKAFGAAFDVGEPTHQEQTGGDQCVWTDADDAPPVKTFSITVYREGALGGALEASGISVEELHEQNKEAFAPVEEIDLGDDAYLAKTELAVLDGDTLYSFSTFLGTSAEAIAGMKTLATQVVG